MRWKRFEFCAAHAVLIVGTVAARTEAPLAEEAPHSALGSSMLQVRARAKGSPGGGQCPGVGLSAGEAARDPAVVHFVYTAGCDEYQLIQAVVLDHSWRAAGNRGRLTRIAVGCEDAAARALLASSPLREDRDFAVFFAEGDLMTVPGTGEKYPARSRPYAISQWMEAARPTEPTVAILDPDFVWQRPLSEHPCVAAVRPGRMLAQLYDIGTDFLEVFARVNETRPSVSAAEVWAAYATGPPWVMDAGDLRTMLPDWGRYTDGQPPRGGLLREQEAFCMAALRHRMPAMGQDGLMVSHAKAHNEAWSRIATTPQDWQPYVLHYCQPYKYGDWSFYKAFLSDGWYANALLPIGKNSVPPPMACGAPLLQEPPAPPAEPDRSKLKQAWMLSKLIPGLNRAFVAYRLKYCKDGGRLMSAGLARTMWPTRCPVGGATRYLVASDARPASWVESAAAGGDACGGEAQLLAVAAPAA